MSVVLSAINSSSAARTCASLAVSRCDVASSRIRIGAFLRKALAIAMRCRCPPESCTPRSPTWVPRPAGSEATNSFSAARSMARCRSSLVASGRARRILSARLELNRWVSCATRAICSRRLSSVISRRSRPFQGGNEIRGLYWLRSFYYRGPLLYLLFAEDAQGSGGEKGDPVIGVDEPLSFGGARKSSPSQPGRRRE